MSAQRLRTTIMGVCAAGMFAISAAAQAVQVDLLILYDGATQNHFNGNPAAAMRSWVDQANTIYRNSNVDIQLRLVGTLRHDPAGSNMSEVLGQVRNNNWVRSKRDELGADFVAQVHRHGSCGVGYASTNAEWAYSVTGPTCGAIVLAHELGHNMGLLHSRAQGDTSGSAYRYGLGHGVHGSFATVMAYPQVYRGQWIARFSNPGQTCNGMPCGVPEGRAQEADAHKALNNLKNHFANFRPTRVPNGSTPNPTNPNPTNPETGNGIVNNAVYTLRARHSNRCADVAWSSSADGANVIQWSCHSANNQRWQFINLGNGYYEIKARHSGKCLDVRASGQANGTNINQWSCNRTAAQQWKVDRLNDGSYRLTARVSGRVLDVSNNSNVLGANIHQWQYLGTNNQRWTLTRVQ